MVATGLSFGRNLEIFFLHRGEAFANLPVTLLADKVDVARIAKTRGQRDRRHTHTNIAKAVARRAKGEDTIWPTLDGNLLAK